MKRAFHGLFKGNEKVFNGLQQIMTHEYPVNMKKNKLTMKIFLEFSWPLHGIFMAHES